MTLNSDAKFKKKTYFWFQIWHEEFDEFYPNHSKVWKFRFFWFFLSKVYKVWAKKIQRSLQNSKKTLALRFQKWYEELGELSLEHSKVWKIVLWWGSFCPKHLMFQLENFRRIVYHDNEGQYKIQRKTNSWLVKWHKEFG